MTASKIWALVVALLVIGGGLVGVASWRQPRAPVSLAQVEIYPGTQRPKPKEGLPAATPAVPAPGTNSIEGPKPDSATAKPHVADLDAKSSGAKPPPAAKTPTPPEPPNGKGEPPHFDVVRVEPSGDTLVAGKGEPNAKVAVLEAGKEVAETQADAGGNFVLLPPPLEPGDHDLTLRQKPTGEAAKDSAQSVAVSLPKAGQGPVIIALAEPGKPTRLLSGSPAAPESKPPGPLAKADVPPLAPADRPTAPTHENKPAADAKLPSDARTTADAKRAPPAQVVLADPQTRVAMPPALKPHGPDLAFRSVELENGSGFFASGVAPAKTPIRIYLNNAHIADVVASPDGQWTLTVKKGLTGGHYVVRADATPDGHTVTARVEVPFDVPVAMAETPKADAPAAFSSSAQAPEPPSAPNPAGNEAVASSADAPPPPSAPNPNEAAASPAPAASEPAAPAKGPTAIGATPEHATAAAVAPSTGAAVGETKAVAKSEADVAPASSAASSSANAVIEDIETALVSRGDNLWNISRSRLGQGFRYTQIYAANSNQIRNPDLIYPGQVFVVPPH